MTIKVCSFLWWFSSQLIVIVITPFMATWWKQVIQTDVNSDRNNEDCNKNQHLPVKCSF